MLDDLLLLRLWTAPDAVRGETRSRIAADLHPIIADTAVGAGAGQETFAAAIERQKAAAHLVTGGRRAARLILTEAGRVHIRAVFQLPMEPVVEGWTRRRTPGWTWWRDHYALPVALGGSSVKGAASLRATLLRQLYLPDLPAHSRQASLPGTVDLLLAKALGVAQANLGVFRRASLRNWANRQPPRSAVQVSRSIPPTPKAGRSVSHLPTEPPAFAEQVLATARRATTGRFGANKVFLSHVWHGLLSAGQASPEEAAAFHERLLRANTAGLLRLSRADLAGAHDPQDVRDSEIQYLGEKFHFLRLD